MKLRAVSLAAFAATALFAAEPTLEFSGVLTADGKTRIALTDRTNNNTTWVEPGEALPGGYVLDRYDPKEEAIFLKKSGQETRLGLVAAKTSDTPTASHAAASGTPNNNVAAARPPPVAPPASTASSPPPVAPPNSPGAAIAGTAAPVTAATSPAPVASATTPTPAASGTAATPTPSTTDTAAVAANPSSVPDAATPNPSAPVAPVDSYAGTTSPSAATTAAADISPTGRPTARANYTIQGGDTLDGIALTHGVSVQQLRQLNPSLNSNSLRAGETLRIR